jgi:putative inorganic carbon (HCO3(-)) transporter
LIRKVAAYLAEIEIWPVGLAVLASMAATRLLPVAIGVALAFWLIRWVACGRPGVRTPADWGIALLLLMAPVALWVSNYPEKTVPQVYRLLTGIALYYAVVNWASTTGRVRLLVFAVISAGLFLALSAPASVEWAAGKLAFIPATVYNRFILLVSDTIHPNVLAGNIVILLPFALALILFAWRSLTWLYRLAAAAALLCITAVLFLTQSRGAWIALAAALIAMLLLRFRRGWVFLVLAAAIGAAAVNRLGMKDILDMSTASGTVGTLEGRLEIWSRAIDMIRDFPFTGIGMGAFEDLAHHMYPFFYYADQSVPHTHNLFLQVAVDLGLPGLVAWLSVFLLVMAAAWRVFQRGRLLNDGWEAGLGAGLLCSQLALAVHGLTDAITWGMVRPAPLIWVLWGLAIAARRVWA